MNKQIIILTFLLNTYVLNAQNCDCEANLNWVRQTFEQNDAGYTYALETKGKEAYQKHNEIFNLSVKEINNTTECMQLLYQWLRFFREGHIAIRPIENSKNNLTKKENQKEIILETKGETITVDIQDFKHYIEAKKEIDYEGVWDLSPYIVGIKKIENTYVGFIITSEVENWKKGDVKFKITLEKNKIHSIFHLRNRTTQESDEVKFFGQNYLQVGNFMMKRISPKIQTEKYIEDYMQLIQAQKPFLEELNSTTLILRIPSFDRSQKEAIDRVISDNKNKILSTENLIIDLRNNGGGSDISFNEILPFIYTNPITCFGVEYFSTKLNNQRMLDFIHKSDYGATDDEKKWAQIAYDTLEKHLGQFINLDSMKTSEITMDTVYTYPKNVGIIINDGNASTTEEFILAAKQSKKVKFFGTTTFGILDISNMYFVNSPCNEFELGYCLTKSLRIPKIKIDGIGLQPDFIIDESIPDYEWVNYVNRLLNSY
ncbi:MAG: peptidase S41 [Flavobacteriia bacterium]|nr:peptidase S41 [Flavobacteriia bacterium]